VPSAKFAAQDTAALAKHHKILISQALPKEGEKGKQVEQC